MIDLTTKKMVIVGLWGKESDGILLPRLFIPSLIIPPGCELR